VDVKICTHPTYSWRKYMRIKKEKMKNSEI